MNTQIDLPELFSNLKEGVPPVRLDEPTSRRPDQGLFQQMLQNDPSNLLSFVTQYAADSAAIPILEALQEGSRRASDLHPEERMVLDTATAEMLTHNPRKKARVQAPPARREVVLDAPPPVMEGNLAAYWWLQ